MPRSILKKPKPYHKAKSHVVLPLGDPYQVIGTLLQSGTITSVLTSQCLQDVLQRGECIPVDTECKLKQKTTF